METAGPVTFTSSLVGLLGCPSRVVFTEPGIEDPPMSDGNPKTLITMNDLARLAGVSTSTVSRALSGKGMTSKKTRKQIAEMARDVDYVPNVSARNLRLKRVERNTIVVPFADDPELALGDPHFLERLACLTNQVTQRGYGVLLHRISSPATSDLFQVIEHASPADGIVLIYPCAERAAIEATARSYRALVTWGSLSEKPTCCTVGPDEVAGARVAVEHLIGLGRQRIVFLGDPARPETRFRLQGYRLALRCAHIDGEVARIVNSGRAEHTLIAMVASGDVFDAVFATNGGLAAGAIRALNEAGLKVPGDVAVIGYDDPDGSTSRIPTLTTVRQDYQVQARLVADMLFRRIAGEETPSVAVPPCLIVRESCGASRRTAPVA
jgi:DNA-binding LacI/PurR family transcriptional regulator